ncbi:FecR family protein [Catenovulum sediminis]|uniref:FecR family protein n=1 Tax=Catenovulum sediminis TaxID=1740262 RepID=UPI00117E476A|nr:FecR family protein [Catenovulum sediminis]
MNMIRIAKLGIIAVSVMFSCVNVAQELAGRTLVASGQVDASSQGQVRKLNRRAPVYQVDTVITGENSKAQFKMSDGGLLAVQANTELIISSYQYDPVTDTGSAVMNLISGGIRTISGKIKDQNGQYQLNTPVGSIGIRGTHYEVELLDGNLFIAVWDGAIDLTVETDGSDELLSFGAGAAYNYAMIQPGGKVVGLLAPPAVFQEGHTTGPGETEEKDSQQEDSSESGASEVKSQQADNTLASPIKESSGISDAPTVVQIDENTQISISESQEKSVLVEVELVPEIDMTNPTEQANEQDIEQDIVNVNPIADRVGIAQFELTEHAFQGIGEVTSATMGLQVNFDQQTVEEGFLSFADQGGEWYARFNGAIRQAELELGVNFASHGDELAEGQITGAFSASDVIKGEISLQEVENPQVSAGGEFELRDTNEL